MASITELEALVAARGETLGGGHPDTLTAMLDLAELLWAEGRLARARELEEEVVAGRTALYGEAHPDRLKALSAPVTAPTASNRLT